MDKMRETIIKFVFEMDIFDWWSDAFENQPSSLENLSLEKIKEIVDQRFDFSTAVMRLIVQLFMLPCFSGLGEDLVWSLYRFILTRKQGKLWRILLTPRSIVSSILDFTHYKAEDNI